MPFGVASALSIFQQLVENVLQGCDGSGVFLDDITVTVRTDEEHEKNLEKALERLKQRGLRVMREKCAFMEDSVEYLGFVIDKNGRHISGEKTKALFEMPSPADISQLRSFLGMVNHYSKLLPQLSAKCAVFISF